MGEWRWQVNGSRLAWYAEVMLTSESASARIIDQAAVFGVSLQVRLYKRAQRNDSQVLTRCVFKCRLCELAC